MDCLWPEAGSVLGSSFGHAELRRHDFRPRRLRYGGNQLFTEELSRRGLSWVVEIPRSTIVATEARSRSVAATELLVSATWKSHDTISPPTGNIVTYSLADLGYVLLPDGKRARLFAAQTGAIDGLHQGTIIGLSSATNTRLDYLLQAVGWARRIRPLVKSEERRLLKPLKEQRSPNKKAHVEVAARSNIKLARQHDESRFPHELDFRSTMPRPPVSSEMC
jgi:hypothetical protein